MVYGGRPGSRSWSRPGLAIAVGRDYGDVSPTSGSFEADYPGRLSSSRRVGVTAVEYGLSRG